MRGILRTLALLLLTACGGGSAPLPTFTSTLLREGTGLEARGEYIVRSVAVCGHCHAADPQNPDGPLVGGHEFSDWRIGRIPAANITPDAQTGIGSWSDAAIVRAIRAGVDDEGELLVPVMPYEWFHGMSDDDALAVARYLRAQQPYERAVSRDESLAFHFGELLFLKPIADPSPERAPARAATAEYGEYLATSVALCADCHTPRTGISKTPDRGRLFAGEANPPAGFPANPANLTPDLATGIGTWTEADFLRAMREGVRPSGDSLNAFMPWKQFRRMTDTDLRAIWTYLRTLPAQVHAIPRGAKMPS